MGCLGLSRQGVMGGMTKRALVVGYEGRPYQSRYGMADWSLQLE